MPSDDFASLMRNAEGSQRAERRLKAGQIVDAPVIQIANEFVYVDVGTPSDGRIPRLELLDETGSLRVAVGDRVRARVLDARPDGPLLESLGQSGKPAQAPAPDEVLKAKVTRVERFGLFVSTPKGDGLVPVRELGLPPSADHKRLFPTGRELEVVLIDASADGKLRFSASRVARVVEERNFRDFSRASAGGGAGGGTPETPGTPAEPKHDFGSLGDLLRGKLPQPSPAKPAPPAAPSPPERGRRRPR